MKYNLNNNKKSNPKVTAKAGATTTLLSLATIIVLVVGFTTSPVLASRFGEEDGGGGAGFIDPTTDFRKAPTVVSGDNIYVAWWTNNSENGNEEVMFRASTDGGATFGDKINLSNTTEADSWNVEIHGEADTVVVSWWETNQTSDIPVARISTDGGSTFGPMLMLGMNGTITGEEEEDAAAATEEEGEEGEAGGEDPATGVIEETFGGT